MPVRLRGGKRLSVQADREVRKIEVSRNRDFIVRSSKTNFIKVVSASSSKLKSHCDAFLSSLTNSMNQFESWIPAASAYALHQATLIFCFQALCNWLKFWNISSSLLVNQFSFRRRHNSYSSLATSTISKSRTALVQTIQVHPRLKMQSRDCRDLVMFR